MEPIETTRGTAGVIIDHVCLAPEDRLDAVVAAGREQLHGAVHDAVIGKPERRLIERGRTRRELLDLARPVQKRVLGVDVEVRAGVAHRTTSSIGIDADI
jgi:hypothetical protein